nr:hypothetical protein [Gammaproteobacteria bacterium]
MNKTLQTTLRKLSQEQLIQVVHQVYESGRAAQALVAQAVAAYNPKELYKLTRRAIADLKKMRRFIDYQASHEFSGKLEQINQSIEKLVNLAPDLAVELCQKFIAIDGGICDRVDDSSGFLTACYTTTYKILDRAFCEAKTDPQVIGTYLFEIYRNDDYGLRGHILGCSKHSLKSAAGEVLESLLQAQPLKDYQRHSALKAIADARGDVDSYITLVEQAALSFHSSLPNPRDICAIAERLNAVFRSEEAINWLQKIGDDEHHYAKKTQLLIEAHSLEGQNSEVRRLYWARFEHYLSIDDYLAYLKYSDASDKQAITQKAIDYARNHSNTSRAFTFLEGINEWDILAAEIIGKVRSGAMENAGFSGYRKLSTRLANHKQYLAATLLRRVLVSELLNSAQSNYYHYGASDLKKAAEFAAEVSDWLDMDAHSTYMKALHNQHGRKYAFWSKVEA